MKRMFVWVVLTMLVGVGVLRAQSNDVSSGTWKLNVEQSKYNPGPPPKARTVTIEPAGQAIVVKVEGVAGDGGMVSYSYAALFDGKDYTVNGMGRPGETVALKRNNPTTVEETFKKGGKVVETAMIVYSADGKMRTVTQKGTNDQGQSMNNVIVYDKQATTASTQ